MDGYFVFMNVMGCILAACIVARHHLNEYNEIISRCSDFTGSEYTFDNIDRFVIQTLCLAIFICVGLSIFRLYLHAHLIGV